jgi:uncharacterized protein YbdZ (MbtH family)
MTHMITGRRRHWCFGRFVGWLALGAALVAVTADAAAAAPKPAGRVPPGWQVTGFAGNRAATDQTVTVEGERWYVKTGASRSAIVYREQTGDVTVTARLDEASGAANARVGLMLWSAVSPTAGNLGLVVDPQGRKLTFLWDESSERAQIGSDSIQADGLGFPLWLRLRRAGSTFQAAYSRDGTDWRSLGPPVRTFWAGNRPEVFVGVYADGAAELRLSQVQVTRGGGAAAAELPAGWTAAVQGAPNFVGEVAHRDGRWSLQGAATRGRGGYHHVTAMQAVPKAVELTARIRLAGLADPRAGGGLLLRAHGTDAGLQVLPAAGQMRFFTRRAADGRVVHQRSLPLPAALVGQADAGLKLGLIEGRVGAFYRAGAGDWVQVGETVTVKELVDEVQGGLELSSESAARAVVRLDFTEVTVAPLRAMPGWAIPAGVAAAAAKATVPAARGPAATAAPPPSRPVSASPVRPPPPSFGATLLGLVGTLLWGLFWLTLVSGLLVIRPFNRLVGLRNHTRKGWAQIDVQLKRRHDLIRNLVETVKGYARHEQATLESVTQARAVAAGATTPSASAAAEVLHDRSRNLQPHRGHQEARRPPVEVSLTCEQKQREIEAMEAQMGAPTFWDNNERAQKHIANQRPEAVGAARWSPSRRRSTTWA